MSCCCCTCSKVSPVEISRVDEPVVREIRKGRRLSIFQYNVNTSRKSKKSVTITQPYNTPERNGKVRPTSAIPRLKLISKKHIITDHPNSARDLEETWYESDSHPITSPSQLETTLTDNLSITHENTQFEVSQGQDKVNTRNDMVIFLLHGVGGSADIWRTQKDFFVNKGYQIVIPELIGHGHSFAPKNPDDYMFKEIAQDLLLIFDQYCKEINFIVAHSYG